MHCIGLHNNMLFTEGCALLSAAAKVENQYVAANVDIVADCHK